MKKFTFSLESVLTLRRHAETVAREALAHELATSREREAELRSADDALASALASTRSAADTGAGLAAWHAYVEHCGLLRAQARRRVDAQHRIVEEARLELQAAAAARAAVERLRERREATYALEQLRAETVELGDLSLARSVARQRAA